MDNQGLPMVQPQNSFLKLELIDSKLLDSNLIPFMVELLVNLVTPILEHASI